MTKEQLQDIFRKPYNAQSWQELLINLFGASEIRQTPSELTSDSNEKVEGFELGRLYAADRYEIGLFAFEIKQGLCVWKFRRELSYRFGNAGETRR